jgi:hypothetical protein
MLSLALGLLLAQSPAVVDQPLTPAPLVAAEAPVRQAPVTVPARAAEKPDRAGAFGLFGFGMAVSVGVSLSATLTLLAPTQTSTTRFLLAPVAIVAGVVVSAIPLLGPAVGLAIDLFVPRTPGYVDPGLPWRVAGNALSLGLQVWGTVLFAQPIAPKPQGPAITGVSVSGNGLALSGQF